MQKPTFRAPSLPTTPIGTVGLCRGPAFANFNSSLAWPRRRGYTFGITKVHVMAAVKTAISIDKPLFEATQRLARKLKVSRSRLFTLALERYLESHNNQRLLTKLNRVHGGERDGDEIELRRAALRNHRTLIEGDW
jgi:hypothetical protein